MCVTRPHKAALFGDTILEHWRGGKRRVVSRLKSNGTLFPFLCKIHKEPRRSFCELKLFFFFLMPFDKLYKLVPFVCLSLRLQAVCICSLHWGVPLCTVHRADLSLLYPGVVRRPALLPVWGLPELPARQRQIILGVAEQGTLGLLLCSLRRGEPVRWVPHFRAF